ncbi:uncharacterized protein [Neodiprion pinetum]|uniref:uncharacterized protein isoform X1 n=2 Tax=Neodiprion pinetum TaxID=441929 RepID=UPI001EDCAC4E|nr:uncharacterized protein LOC124222259 isoform X1 [Neodiprion pinetum]
MLPESNFPVTGGIMQTEEVVPRATSAGIDTGSPTEEISHQQTQLLLQRQHSLPSQRLPSPVESLTSQMAVKQEPQDEEEHQGRTSSSPQVEAHAVQTGLPNGGPGQVQVLQNQATMGRAEVQPTQDCTGGRARPSRGRRKSRWKLKFHHQALPPEYLDHYEAALAREALNSPPTPVHDSTAPSPAPTTSTSTPSPVADVHGWLQRIAAMQQELCPPAMNQNPVASSPQTPGFRRSVITSTPHPQHHPHSGHHHPVQQTQPAPRPPMKYSDLPYMGEITLDNSKPRRGRKPKKADICHLIYKNYGTILPGTPGLEERKQLGGPRVKMEMSREQPAQVSFQRTDIQNRISSLLEKRLTQESRRNHSAAHGPRTTEQEEPLNLCVRDLNQLKIRLLRKHGNVYESGQVKSEGSSDGEEVECLGAASPTEPGTDGPPVSNGVGGGSSALQGDSVIPANPGFVYWPNAGVFIHPMALQSQFLYYQKMAQGEGGPGFTPAMQEPPPKEQKIVPKSIYSMLESKSPAPAAAPPPPTTPTPQHPAAAAAAAESPRAKRSGPTGGHAQPTKRKRSAIFIPPMPTENNNNPATEVSICKFKFTGGAKPSLQEKKSLSVDSGGNFRYYSGTGDKSMRGYEFFPREALQQPAGQAGSSAGAFLNAAGERIPPPGQRPPVPEDGRRKRKTRKSLQREKLEQTFKEKGFLIQTQQLESAEGATYCKFRQLRKFTRYLFRSWKDYLPGNVRELTGAEGEPEVEGEADRESPVIRPHVGPPGVVELPPAILDEPQPLPLT